VGDLEANTRELDDLIAVVCDLKGVNDRLAEEVVARRAKLESQLRSELSVSVEREVRAVFQAVDEERSKLAAEAAELSDRISEHRKAIANLEMGQSELAAQLRDELASLQGSLEDLPDSMHEQAHELSRRVSERLKNLVEGVELTPALAPLGHV
jgi:phage shock protein A